MGKYKESGCEFVFLGRDDFQRLLISVTPDSRRSGRQNSKSGPQGCFHQPIFCLQNSVFVVCKERPRSVPKNLQNCSSLNWSGPSHVCLSEKHHLALFPPNSDPQNQFFRQFFEKKSVQNDFPSTHRVGPLRTYHEVMVFW